MRGYRSELPSLRRRVRVLERELRELEKLHQIGRSAAGRGARTGYAAGRWVARQLRRLWPSEQRELERLRARERKLLDEIAILSRTSPPEPLPTEESAEDAPASGRAANEPSPLRKRLGESGHRLGRSISRLFRGD